jgi:uncharacterized Zn-binding protein involved in type VI secretion
MGFPASRLTDMHVCPMVTPGVPPIPHVGGPITAPGAVTVVTCGLIQSHVGDMCVCVGPPDVVTVGSPTVIACGTPATRITSNTAHGGIVVLGAPTVLIA